MKRPGWWVLAVGLLLAVIIGAVLLQQSRLWNAATVIPVGDMRPVDVRLFQDLWVTRQPDGTFVVFQNRDPHKGHPTEWLPPDVAAERFRDTRNFPPAGQGAFLSSFAMGGHGEIYSLDGSCVAGPCPGGLYRVAAKLVGWRPGRSA